MRIISNFDAKLSYEAGNFILYDMVELYGSRAGFNQRDC